MKPILLFSVLFIILGCSRERKGEENQYSFNGSNCNDRIGGVLTMVEKWNQKYDRREIMNNIAASCQARVFIIEYGGPMRPSLPKVHQYTVVKEMKDSSAEYSCFVSNSKTPLKKGSSANFRIMLDELLATNCLNINVENTNPIVMLCTLMWPNNSRYTYVRYGIPDDFFTKWNALQ